MSTPGPSSRTGGDDDRERTPRADRMASVQLRMLAQSGEECVYKVRRSTPLRRLGEVYAKRLGKDVNGLRMLFDGMRINREDTPETLAMVDDDTIDVAIEQIGG